MFLEITQGLCASISFFLKTDMSYVIYEERNRGLQTKIQSLGRTGPAPNRKTKTELLAKGLQVGRLLPDPP
jgi:hypothetical protein